MARTPPPNPLPDTPTSLEGVDESTWLDVIHKMDEVYSQLVHDEIALEEKNAELEQSQQFIFSVLSSMSDVLLVVDGQGRVEETNAALCELVGRPEAALRGQPLSSLLADEASRERVQAVLGLGTGMGSGFDSDTSTGIGATRAGASLELNLAGPPGPDGQPLAVPVDTNATPRIGAQGRRVGTVFVGRPTAELKRAYHELRAAHESLKKAQQQLLHSEKMASLGRLVAGVAHELNNPISFVLGNVHALSRYSQRLGQYLAEVHAGRPLDELAPLRRQLRIDHVLGDLPSLIEGTLEGAQRTADIVGGLKRFSAMDPEARVPVAFNEVIERAMLWVRKGNGAGVAMHWAGGPPATVLGSAGQLQQVLMNLLQNACDAVTGAGSPATEPALWVDTAVGQGWLTLKVRDNGTGIPPEHLSRLFDPFFTTKPVGKGTGLGLSISYGIVEQHGGRLGAANAVGGGAEFVLELPVVDG